MILRSADGSEFELRIAGYEFPEDGLGADDDDWLQVRVRVTTPCGSWEATDPSLETWDVAALADWLEDLAQGRLVRWKRLEFTEPNLSFGVLHNAHGRVLLRAYFELELRPPWAERDYVGEPDLWVDLDVIPEDLATAAESLRHELNRFPVRGDEDGDKERRRWRERSRRQRERLRRIMWQRIRVSPRPLR
jgi:hypothetical protein